jgi:hypothetical protein
MRLMHTIDKDNLIPAPQQDGTGLVAAQIFRFMTGIIQTLSGLLLRIIPFRALLNDRGNHRRKDRTT